MDDAPFVSFLQWALPQMDLRWEGFRKVRGQVRKRLTRRLAALHLEDLAAYRAFLDRHPDEWRRLDELCRITISRFYRNRAVFDALSHDLLPALARKARNRGLRTIHAWSAGCGAGEEAYTLRIIWLRRVQPLVPEVHLELIATDGNRHQLERTGQACYPHGALKEMPHDLLEAAFLQETRGLRLWPEYRTGITWLLQDVREKWPEGSFHLVLCRNLVFTYFAPELQTRIGEEIRNRMQGEGLLVVGAHERLPDAMRGYVETNPCPGIFVMR